jgi:hypothetical protein
MARRVIKTMAAKMAESGKEAGKDVLDDSDLSSDPIINALQTLRSQIDDFQHNDNDLDITNLKSAINANTNRGSGSDGAKGDTGNTGARGPAGNNGSNGSNGSAGARGPAGAAGAAGSLEITEGYAATLAVTSSRGTYTLTINVTSNKFEGTKSVELTLG